MPQPAIAFLSNRKVHVRKDGSTRVIDSEFERSVKERAASIERRHAWKTQGRGAMFTGGAFGAQAGAAAQTPVLVTGLSAGTEGGLLYSLETDAVSGIFLLDAAGVETRLFHTADLRIRHATLDSGGATLAATAFHKEDMRSNIAVLALRGTEFSEVTEGDSFDQLPRWVPGEGRRVVFQSAGIGRDGGGRFAGLAPCTVQQLDLDSGELEEVAAEEGHDLLQPLRTADGAIYYIRKPYESGIRAVSLLGSLRDTALFPFRMAMAVFQYFNVFSMMYTGKPLVTNQGAVQRRLDPRQMFIHGNLAHAMAAQTADDPEQGLVPSSWELVRRGPAGHSETIAKHVLTFDVGADGSFAYSDGNSIFHGAPGAKPERVLRADLVERVLIL